MSFSKNPSAARTLGSSGAVRQSASAAFTSAGSLRASDATAPWDSVQKTH